MTGFDQAWAAYLCALQGHIRAGVGASTNPEHILWDDHCQRCGMVVGGKP